MIPAHALRHIYDLSKTDLKEWCGSVGQPAFRADQIQRWLFSGRITSFAQMHNIPLPLRHQLAETFSFYCTEMVEHLVSRDRTEKLLLQLDDGNHVECVLMREPRRRTVCISSQAGCGMGCVFCASGLMGLQRNLSCGEILEQIVRLDCLLEPGERITNLVVMGIGEPLANLPALLPAMDTIHDESGLSLGARRITISTVGLPEKIRELARLGRPFNLAISLHAPNDELRNQLVPVNVNIGIRAILDAADAYFEKTGRRVTFEYVLLGKVNDSPIFAKQLAAILKNRNAHVNLIPMNDVAELPFTAPAQPRTREFIEILQRESVRATVRKRKGADIDAACGQLRLKKESASLAPRDTFFDSNIEINELNNSG